MKRKSEILCSVVLAFSIFLLSGCSLPVENVTTNSETHTTTVDAETSKPTVATTENITTTQATTAKVPISTTTDVPTQTTEASTVSTTKEEKTTQQTTQAQITDVESLIENMTLREKIGQMFIIRPDSLDKSQTSEQVNEASAVGVKKLSGDMKKVLKNYPVGGIVMFGKNITGAKQLTDFISDIQDASEIPTFIAIDEEGGKVARLANSSAFNLPKYESAAAVGKSGNPSDAKSMGKTIGKYLKKYGFNMDFAPVADVNTNPNNPIIGSRAFSSDPKIAAKMVSAMADGLQGQGIIPVFKHFPGHGDTAEDSHNGIAVSNKTQEQMEKCEWLAYESLTEKYCVMVGHIATPKITDDLTPASMSYKIVTAILRDQMNFNGVVITDSLAMGAVTEEYASGQAAINAIKAGCDILLGPEDFLKAYDAVENAVKDGTISEERINESVYRILTLKKEYGILVLESP